MLSILWSVQRHSIRSSYPHTSDNQYLLYIKSVYLLQRIYSEFGGAFSEYSTRCLTERRNILLTLDEFNKNAKRCTCNGKPIMNENMWAEWGIVEKRNYYVKCSHCNDRTGLCNSPQNALKAWNKRKEKNNGSKRIFTEHN